MLAVNLIEESDSCQLSIPSVSSLLPGSLADTRNNTLVGEFAEADAANSVLTEISVRSAADLASVVLSRAELLRSLLLDDH